MIDQPLPEPRPTSRLQLADVMLDGDDVRDIARFDDVVRESLTEAAETLRSIPRFKLEALRNHGYATRLEISAAAEAGTLELELPPSLVAACGLLEIGIQFCNEQLVMVDPEHHDLRADDEDPSGCCGR